VRSNQSMARRRAGAVEAVSSQVVALRRCVESANAPNSTMEETVAGDHELHKREACPNRGRLGRSRLGTAVSISAV